jgi:CelD/BcsL family acetyltransferase involved in cellulose biosynthesis
MHELLRVASELGQLAPSWNRLAHHVGSIFCTHEWLTCWWRAYGHGEPRWLVLDDGHGLLRAGALMFSPARSQLSSASNIHSGSWDAVAADEDSLAELWAGVAQEGLGRMRIAGMLEEGPGARIAAAQLERAGYSTTTVPGQRSPWLDLPGSWEELLASVSGGLRSQVQRRRRKLERQGDLSFRTVTGGVELEQALESFLTVEASGWKTRSRTAVISQPATERLYREFAPIAAEQGWLRLYLLELDGRLIAADYGCAYAGQGMLLKTGFDEDYARFSPGLVLRAEVLRASIEEGLDGYDFLGQPETYKTRWASRLRPRVTILAYRGAWRPAYFYRTKVRGLLKSARSLAAGMRLR